MTNASQLLESAKQFVFELPSLVMVNLGGVSKARNEIIEQPVCCGLPSFVPGGIGLCKSCEVVHYYQDVFKSTPAGFQVKEVNTHKFEGRA